MQKIKPLTTTLGKFPKGKKGKIVALAPNGLLTRFLELGFLEGESVEVVHEAPFGKDPLAVRVRGTLFAMRRCEADNIEVVEVLS